MAHPAPPASQPASGRGAQPQQRRHRPAGGTIARRRQPHTRQLGVGARKNTRCWRQRHSTPTRRGGAVLYTGIDLSTAPATTCACTRPRLTADSWLGSRAPEAPLRRHPLVAGLDSMRPRNQVPSARAATGNVDRHLARGARHDGCAHGGGAAGLSSPVEAATSRSTQTARLGLGRDLRELGSNSLGTHHPRKGRRRRGSSPRWTGSTDLCAAQQGSLLGGWRVPLPNGNAQRPRVACRSLGGRLVSLEMVSEFSTTYRLARATRGPGLVLDPNQPPPDRSQTRSGGQLAIGGARRDLREIGRGKLLQTAGVAADNVASVRSRGHVQWVEPATAGGRNREHRPYPVHGGKAYDNVAPYALPRPCGQSLSGEAELTCRMCAVGPGPALLRRQQPVRELATAALAHYLRRWTQPPECCSRGSRCPRGFGEPEHTCAMQQGNGKVYDGAATRTARGVTAGPPPPRCRARLR